jgi:peptidoglycan/xylan/chitin deacetylase (PgdA/CDA1 family)
MITLMYHGITSKDSKSPPDREIGAALYDVPVEVFRAQMRWLKSCDQKAVLTFDDGEMNNYRVAFPIIKEFGFNAYFFIIVKRIGENGYMGFEELKNLVAAGMTIGSHSLSHEIMTNLKDNQVIEELKASKTYLEMNLGVPIRTFSVPRGFYNDKIIQMAYEAGYTQIFISEKRTGSKSICTPRRAVKANWSLKRFQQALEDHVPLGEIIRDAFKNMAKIVLREPGYNFLRRILIYITKWKWIKRA